MPSIIFYFLMPSIIWEHLFGTKNIMDRLLQLLHTKLLLGPCRNVIDPDNYQQHQNLNTKFEDWLWIFNRSVWIVHMISFPSYILFYLKSYFLLFLNWLYFLILLLLFIYFYFFILNHSTLSHWCINRSPLNMTKSSQAIVPCLLINSPYFKANFLI